MEEVTAEVARELLKYEPVSGLLFWRERDRKWFTSDTQFKRWNARCSGKEAFTYVNTCGYRKGTILYRLYAAHRIIWLMQTGEFPKHQIDHVNHDRADNRWDNLREATPSENQRNQSQRRDNTSGVTGVSWHKQVEKWRVQIIVDGVRKHVGLFQNLEDAAAARKAAEAQLGYHNNHGRTA